MEKFPAATVFDLDYQGRGVAKIDGQVVFIEGALPDETVTFCKTSAKKQFIEAVVDEIIEPSPHRVAPRCPFYDRCGGCALQHWHSQAQLLDKQKLWLTQLQRLGGAQPEHVLPPLAGKEWRYRRRARLAVHYENDVIAVGFKAKRSHDVVAVNDCLILQEHLAAALPLLPDFLRALLPVKVDEILLTAGEKVAALTLRTKKRALSPAWGEKWANLAGAHWQLWENDRCLFGEPNDLYYQPISGVTLHFTPDDFIQVNASVNEALIQTVLAWLAPLEKSEVLDLFSGLGNFSLPLAYKGARVTAVEGVRAMVQRGAKMAAEQQLSSRLEMQCMDLFSVSAAQMKSWQSAKSWLLDPPRAGAHAVVQALPKKFPEKIVYVSCNPATLARDVAILQSKGFHLERGQVVNMFAHSAHIESVILMTRTI